MEGEEVLFLTRAMVESGERLDWGEALYAIYTEFPADFRFARALAGRDSGYGVAEGARIPRAFSS